MPKCYDNRNSKSTKIYVLRYSRGGGAEYDAGMQTNEWLKERLRQIGSSNKALADTLGLAPSRITEIINGNRKVQLDELQPMADHLQWPIRKLMDKIQHRDARVPVVGRVGAGAEVFGIDDHAMGEGFYKVEPPDEWPNKTFVAAEVIGDSLEPIINPGSLLFFLRDWTGVPIECHYKLCVVKTEDGKYLAKRIVPNKDGTFNLESTNAAPMYNQRLEWAARIYVARPKLENEGTP